MSGASPPDDLDREWWKEAVVYQIYPQSFNDSDGDGVGDLQGIVEKADYLDDLGVDVVWLNPVYESPQEDNGYDIADYRSINPEYGDMADWEELRDELHDRDIRLIMDLVVNHTSDQHEWFQRSRANPDGPYGDYYHWVEGEPDEPPNNWTSGFGGSAWSWDEKREAWYLHLFDETQPDLNWRNPEVRREIFDMMTWWLEQGIDGFRMDVINLISKPAGYPEGDESEDWVGSDLFANGPKVHDYLSTMYDEVLADYDVMTVGECIGADVDDAIQYTLPDGDGLSMVFHFDHVLLDFHEEEGWWKVADWDLTELKAVFDRWQTDLEGHGWNSSYLGNHDWPRIVSRYGDDGEYREESAKLLGTLVHGLQGTPYLFQGDEIGMTNYPFDGVDELRDADATNRIELAIEEGDVADFEEIKELIRYRARDNARTPMQWDDSANAGFTDGEPWIGVNPNHDEINVAAARADPDSIWHYYRDLVALREEHDVLVYGTYDQLTPDDEQVWAFTRTLGDEQVLVVLNVSGEPATLSLPASATRDGYETLLANYERADDDPAALDLRPWEARVYLAN